MLCSLFHHPLLHSPPSKGSEASGPVSCCLHAGTWGRLGQPIPLWPCQFVLSPRLALPELQMKMFLQGSAEEQRLGAWSSTHPTRDPGESCWGHKPDITATTIPVAQPARTGTAAPGHGSGVDTVSPRCRMDTVSSQCRVGAEP